MLREKTIKSMENIKKAIEEGNSRLAFMKIKSKEINKNSMPKRIIYKKKRYTGKKVLSGFAQVAMDDAEDPMIKDVEELTREYVEMKEAARTALACAELEDFKLKPLTKESFKELLKKIPKRKALDASGLSLEHLLLVNESIMDLVMKLLNCIIEDLDYSSHPLLSLGVATMLYKCKGKLKDLPASYRRVQISSFYLKALQRMTIEQAGILTQKSTHKAQYGFRKGVSFLQCSVLRETITRHAHYNNYKLYLLSTDISNAFSCTLRWIQLLEMGSCS